MALTELTFAALADVTLHRLADMIEGADEDGTLDVELIAGILTVDLPSGRQFVINKHGPSQQIWLSSPFSGGLHFSYDEEGKCWKLADGTHLDTLVRADIETVLATEPE